MTCSAPRRRDGSRLQGAVTPKPTQLSPGSSCIGWSRSSTTDSSKPSAFIPAVLRWLPDGLDRIVEVGAGTGRLTRELLHRARELVAVEPAAPLREMLAARLARADRGCRARAIAGFFDDLQLPTDWADLVVACSAFTPAAGHGGEAGLEEMERVCRPGGLVVIVWPNNVDWLLAHEYEYVSFAGEMFVEFASHDEAAELIEIFYPSAAPEVRGRARRRISYEALGINPPRDIAFKAIGA